MNGWMMYTIMDLISRGILRSGEGIQMMVKICIIRQKQRVDMWIAGRIKNRSYNLKIFLILLNQLLLGINAENSVFCYYKRNLEGLQIIYNLKIWRLS